jgi:heme/copper-type cytochrome/quinol oxidase subunit 2
LIPCGILFILLVPSYGLIYSIDENASYELLLRVTGNQWYWTYEYPEQKIKFDSYMVPEKNLVKGQFRLLEVDNRLLLPRKTNIKVLVTSKDVLHSFAVPSLGIKIDATPGRLNAVTINILRSGVYYGQCSELCGVNHGFMPIVIEVSDPIGFAKKLRLAHPKPYYDALFILQIKKRIKKKNLSYIDLAKQYLQTLVILRG